jgi:dTMP kinase
MNKEHGLFIVIDGTDGSGKTTQLELLKTRLEKSGHSVAVADFPQYNQKSAGLVEEYLSGKYGSADEVGPYIGSIFYAVDRYDASFQIRNWLKEGKIVLSNRYVTANMGHQGGKIANPLERKAYFEWLHKLEFELFNIPKPNLNIILHVPAEVAQELAQTRAREDWGGKTKDIHEDNLDHLKKAEETYLEIAKNYDSFSLISCSENQQIKPRETIHEYIWEEINGLLHRDADELSIIEVERLSETAKLPTRAHATDAGLDLYSDRDIVMLPGERHMIETGIRMAIPHGFAGLIWDKSSISSHGIKTLGGVIDSGFRGEIKVGLINLSHEIYRLQAGQKIAQILFQKIARPRIKEAKLETDTARADGSYGSTGLF